MKCLIILFILIMLSGCTKKYDTISYDNSFLLGTIIGTLISLR